MEASDTTKHPNAATMNNRYNRYKKEVLINNYSANNTYNPKNNNLNRGNNIFSNNYFYHNNTNINAYNLPHLMHNKSLMGQERKELVFGEKIFET